MPRYPFFILGFIGSLFLAGGGFLPLHQLQNGRTISLYTSINDIYSWSPLCACICLVSLLVKGYVGAIVGSLLPLFTLHGGVYSYWDEIGTFGPGTLAIVLGMLLSFGSAVILNFQEFPPSGAKKSNSPMVSPGVHDQIFREHIPIFTSAFIVAGCSFLLFVIALIIRGKIAFR